MEITKTNIYQALLEAQKEFDTLKKTETATVPTKGGGQYKYNYVDLEAVLNHVLPILHKHGLILLQPSKVNDGAPVLLTKIIHVESGDSVEGEYPIVSVDASDPQKVGASVTYSRRYALLSMLGIATEDDDALSASGHSKTASSPSQPHAKPASNAERDASHDVKCEIPSCTNKVWAEKVENSKKYNKGHVICYFHSTNGNWEEQLEREIYEAEQDQSA